MQSFDRALIDGVRSSSRQIVRELGFMNATLASTNYPASAVHAILEIGHRGALSAGALTERLGLEKSSISRMVRKLIDSGELRETTNESDGRLKNLTLTDQGRKTFAAIESFGRKQVSSALKDLSPAESQIISAGLAAYARALSRSRTGRMADLSRSIHIEQGYRPGSIGRITEMHADFYARHSQFGQFFESQVAAGLAEFASRLNSARNGLWTARHAGRTVGSIAVDGGNMDGDDAHLRWFIVDGSVRGGGVGRKLLRQAIDFCDQSEFAKIYLWTFDSLHAARHLYEENGFRLAKEQLGRQWGTEVNEQLFVRVRGQPIHQSG